MASLRPEDLGSYLLVFSVLVNLCNSQCQCRQNLIGMSISWKPTGTAYKVDVNFRVTFRQPFVFCNETTIESGTLIDRSAHIRCFDGCGSPIPEMEHLSFYCTHFSIPDSYATGINKINYTFPTNVDNIYRFGFQGPRWGVSVLARANLTTRPDTGDINYSPVTYMPPIVKVKSGCNHIIQIPVQDVERDKITCRWASNVDWNECGDYCSTLPNAIINENTCVIDYSAPSSTGLYVVAMQVEDYYPDTNVKMSSVPLQVLFDVVDVSDPCGSEPVFVDPTPADGACLALNESYSDTITATSPATNRTVVEIVTVTPTGFTKTAIQAVAGSTSEMYVNVSWTPTAEQLGPNIYCFYATDDLSMQSAVRCLTILAGITTPSVVPDSQNPGNGSLVDIMRNVWMINFDTEFYKPTKTAYMKFYKADGTLHHQIDVSTANTTYPNTTSGRTLTIYAQVPFDGFQDYYILLDEGVAVTGFCGALSEAVTDTNFWRISVDGDRCEHGIHNCSVNADCVPELSFSGCWPLFSGFTCTCKAGYSGDGVSCSDVNECTTNTNQCDVDATCNNTIGSHVCTCDTGYTGDGINCTDVNECTTNTDECNVYATCNNTIGSHECTCNTGFSRDGINCTDIDECVTGNHTCHPDADCGNTVGSYTCGCKTGFSGDGFNCIDINECTSNASNCDSNADCGNTVGSFTCTCVAGFTGNGISCLDINECTDETHTCDPGADCSNDVGSFNCTCKTGYTGDGYNCTDINECTSNTDNCDTNADCGNIIGSFTCTCRAGYTGDGVSCLDINECTSNTHNCDTNADCGNTIGSFTCTCRPSYSGDGVTCLDINECTEGLHNCDANAECSNTFGSFICVCKTGYAGNGLSCADVHECSDESHNCHINADCSNTFGSFTCACKPGYTGDGLACSDINECTAGTDICHTDADCINSLSSYTCLCKMGYTGNGFSCIDINECSTGTHTCHRDADCTNNHGSFTCACKVGYSGNGFQCIDKNECTLGTHACNTNAGCGNTIGSYRCTCNDGYSGDGFNCIDVNECSVETDDCHTDAECTNVIGSYNCACKTGYSGDGVTCTDLNECSLGTDNCHTDADCTNTIGSFTCACKTGFSGNGFSCLDIHECSTNTDNCHKDAGCTNNQGSFVCACNSGFLGDGVSCTDINECTVGTDICSNTSHCTNNPGSYSCACWSGYIGNGYTCTEINECTSGTHNCSQFANCTNTPGSFTCTCKTGYNGNGVDCYATITTYQPIRVETKFSMALQTGLSIPGNLDDVYSRDYQTALGLLSQELTPKFQQRLGDEFVELEILSIRDGGKIIEYAVTSTTKDSQWKVFNTAKDLVNGDEPFKYAGKAAHVEAARITFNDESKLITPSNVNTFSCELYESLRPCEITEQCEITSGEPGCHPIPQTQALDVERVSAYIAIPFVAAIVGFVVTAIFCCYQRRKRRKQKEEKEFQEERNTSLPTMAFPPQSSNFLARGTFKPGESIQSIPRPKIRDSGYNASRV